MRKPRLQCAPTASSTLARYGCGLVAFGAYSGRKRKSGARRMGPESGASLVRVLVVIIWVAVVIAAVGVGWKLSRGSVAPGNTPGPATPAALATPAAGEVKPAASGVDATQRKEVLKRIDIMPNVAASSKERLYVYVDRAQRISRVMNVNFERGKTKLGEAAIKKIVEESRMPEFASQAHDPAVVFVVLGFADKADKKGNEKKGNEKNNLQVSLERADNVMEVLRKHCGVLNVIQTVPMGVSDLFNAQELAGNRVAEVWAVLP